MARQKGGLGRGLSSLLGGEFNSNASQEPASPVKENSSDNSNGKGEVERKEQSGSQNQAQPQPKDSNNTISETHNDESRSSKIEPSSDSAVNSNTKDSPAKKDAASSVDETDANAPDAKNAPDATEVPIEQVYPNPNQPRKNFKKEDLEELAESIKRNGLLQPILVRKTDTGYQIIAGERRWQACKLIHLESVPIRVQDVDDDETIVLALVENIQRSDLNPIEEAYGYRSMMERGKMTQSQVAQAVSKGRSTIANALRLLELPEAAQQLLFEEKITAGHARAILSVPTKEGRTKLTKKLVSESLSVRETESIARLLSGKKEAKPTEPRIETPKSYKTVARSLRESLQTDVRVKSVKGKNKIEIMFEDEADLERLFRIIASE